MGRDRWAWYGGRLHIRAQRGAPSQRWHLPTVDREEHWKLLGKLDGFLVRLRCNTLPFVTFCFTNVTNRWAQVRQRAIQLFNLARLPSPPPKRRERRLLLPGASLAPHRARRPHALSLQRCARASSRLRARERLCLCVRARAVL